MFLQALQTKEDRTMKAYLTPAADFFAPALSDILTESTELENDHYISEPTYWNLGNL